MLVNKKGTNLKKIILIVFMTIIGGVTLYLLYSNFSGDLSVPHKQSIGVSKLNVPEVNIDFDSSYFGKSPYKDLIQYGDLPVEAGLSGRSNPFSALPFHVIPPSTEE